MNGGKAMARKKTPAPVPVDKIADEWARTWGETVNRTIAARMLGVSRFIIYDWIAKGYLPTAPNGNVLVRSAATFANSNLKLGVK
jgi:hypothetical protein